MQKGNKCVHLEEAWLQAFELCEELHEVNCFTPQPDDLNEIETLLHSFEDRAIAIRELLHDLVPNDMSEREADSPLKVIWNVREQRENNIIEETRLNSILIYSLSDCEFNLFESNLTQKQVNKMLFDYKSNNSNASLYDFTEYMKKQTNIKWEEVLVDNNIDFDFPSEDVK